MSEPKPYYRPKKYIPKAPCGTPTFDKRERLMKAVERLHNVLQSDSTDTMINNAIASLEVTMKEYHKDRLPDIFDEWGRNG
jgi:hypothetical protein